MFRKQIVLPEWQQRKAELEEQIRRLQWQVPGAVGAERQQLNGQVARLMAQLAAQCPVLDVVHRDGTKCRVHSFSSLRTQAAAERAYA